MSHTYRAVIDHVPSAGEPVTLDADDAHHLLRVARRGAGDAVELIDPRGTAWPAVIAHVDPRLVVVVGDGPRARPASAEVTLAVGPLEWGRFDLLVEKAVELGAARIVMFTSERRGRRVDQAGFDRRRERLARIAEAAAKQSGGGRIAIEGLVPLPAVIDAIPPAQGFLLDPGAQVRLGDAITRSGGAGVTLVIGPDAGLTAAEVAAARDAGVVACALSANVLRAETAAIAALAVATDRLAAPGDG